MDASRYSIRKTTASAQTTATTNHIPDDAAMGIKTSSNNSSGGGVPRDGINRNSSILEKQRAKAEEESKEVT